MRRQKLFKQVSILTALILGASTLSGCRTSQKDTLTEAGESKVESNANVNAETADSPETATLKLFLPRNRDIVDGSYAITEIEKVTNTHLDILQVTSSEMDKKLNILLASGDIPDIIQCETETMEAQLLDSGILLPINEYWDKYPNIKNARTEEIWDLMEYSDGKVYSIGIQNPNPLNITSYRKDWLDKFGMEIPQTIDEYYEFAKKIALEDPDENGQKDTFALGGHKVIDATQFDHIFGAYGALPNYWMEKNGRIVNGSVQPEMKEALTMLNNMYKEGIIDPEFVTDDSKRWQQKVKSGVYGAGVTKIHIFDVNNWNNYYGTFKQACPDGALVYGPVLQGANDNPIGIRRNSERGWLRTFIYKDSEHVDAALRLLDYLMSEEGNRFVQYGYEGEHYKWEGEKLVRLFSEEEMQELDLNKIQIGNNVLFDHSSDELFNAFEYAREISIANPVDGIFIPELTDLYPKLQEIANIRYIEMIVGETPIDLGFEAFVEEWNSRGGQELEEALNIAYQARK